ncbi:MAG: LysM domain-containing protein, partial [Bacteroidetes bacterium]
EEPPTPVETPEEIIEEAPEDAPEPTEGPTSNPDFTDEPEIAPEPGAALFHTVSQGDTLWNISKRYNTSVDAIKRLNNLTDNTIRLGMKLRVK